MFVIACVLSLLTVLCVYFKWSYQYWQRKKVPFLQPQIPWGNVTNPLKREENLGMTFQKIYNEMKTKRWKHGGIYLLTKPAYFVVDLDYVKNILTKDFQYFTDRGFYYYNEKDDPLSAHLVAIGGIKWRNLRTKLTPTFTSGKVKMMFQTVVECEELLQQKMLKEYEKKKPLDIKNILGCFTTDVVGSCAFGLDCKTIQQDDSPFRVYGEKVFVPSKMRTALFTFASTFPNLGRKFGITFNEPDVMNFYMNLVKDTVGYREKNNVTRKDLLQILIDLMNNPDENGGKSMTIEELAAQCFVFFLAGFETSSTTMAFALYELAKNQDLQEKLRDEINTVLKNHDEKITYESIQDMKYMDKVIDEALRKYPPLPFLTRECVKDYKIPNKDTVIEKGTLVVIPLLAIHNDKEYYPDPEKFDPDRFKEENKASRHPYAHIPFGEGPRICIGMRFGLIQVKVGLTSVLKNYKFTVNEKTKEPLHMKNDAYFMAAEGEIWLDVEKL